MAKGKKTGGRKVGSRNKVTLDKLAAREFVRERVTESLGPLIEAQLAHAVGIKYLVVRAKNGKFIRVTEAMAREREGLQDDEEIIEVWEKDPSVQAFTDLLNRALDKPKEQEIEVTVRSVEAEARVARLVAARKKVPTKK